MTTRARPTRQRKTDRQRAEEALGLAQRKRDRLQERAEQLRVDLHTADDDLADAEARLDYASKDPALQGSSTTPSTTTPPRGDIA